MQFVNADEAIKRLATAQGIDVLNLIKSADERKAMQDDQLQKMQQAEMVKQAGQFASAPMMDPAKNPEAKEVLAPLMQGLQQAQQPAPAQ